MMTQIRPQTSEYAPYYGKYIDAVPDGDLLATLEFAIHEWNSLLGGLSESQADFRYEPAKWSIKEVIGHVTDTERNLLPHASHRTRRSDASTWF